ncbi:MAG TPA: polyprenyl diphosphate synthase, partial [Daejeonella sp.]|uniref:polyprenyl diphosphate synthase n=1 Tax=Daejeonella sp. TaxID=2805397 RepID=UPI002ED8F0DC
MSLIEQIDKDKLPQHVAVIMDGNGRWAKEKGKLRVFGHQNGVVAVRDTVEGAVELGIKYLTLYAFSTENWNRPKLEVMALMELLVSTISKETKTLMDNGVRLNAIGNLSSLPEKCRKQLMEAIKKTSLNTNCT